MQSSQPQKRSLTCIDLHQQSPCFSLLMWQSTTIVRGLIGVRRRRLPPSRERVSTECGSSKDLRNLVHLPNFNLWGAPLKSETWCHLESAQSYARLSSLKVRSAQWNHFARDGVNLTSAAGVDDGGSLGCTLGREEWMTAPVGCFDLDFWT